MLGPATQALLVIVDPAVGSGELLVERRRRRCLVHGTGFSQRCPTGRGSRRVNTQWADFLPCSASWTDCGRCGASRNRPRSEWASVGAERTQGGLDQEGQLSVGQVLRHPYTDYRGEGSLALPARSSTGNCPHPKRVSKLAYRTSRATEVWWFRVGQFRALPEPWACKMLPTPSPLLRSKPGCRRQTREPGFRKARSAGAAESGEPPPRFIASRVRLWRLLEGSRSSRI